MIDSEKQELGSKVATRLMKNIDPILHRWSEIVRAEIKAAAKVQQPILIDTLPVFLKHLAQALSPAHPRADAADGSTVPQEHGSERARLTRYHPDDVIREYQILREVVINDLSQVEPLTPHDYGVIIKPFDVGISESCVAYFLVYSALREQFTATLTHDLRNPLTAARASASMIMKRAENADTTKWAARVIHNIDRADAMIHDLLDASRVRAGERLPLDIKECSLLTIARDATTRLESIHGERFRIAECEPSIRGFWSHEALCRAIENLGGNAVKYGETNTPITLTVTAHSGRAIICVHNEGTPIPIEEQELLFQAYRRAKSAMKSGNRGWGIGLALVRGVAESHGGSISVDSLPEAGTTFTIDIPLDARPFQDAPIT